MTKTSTPLKLLLLVLVIAAAVAFIWKAPHPFELYRTQALPDFALTTLEGKNIHTKDWNDYRPRAYNIFASWCGPCKQELPQIKALNEVIPVYGIAVQDSAANIKKLLEKQGNPFAAVALDNQNFSGLLLGVSGLPTTLIIDKYGKIAAVYEGPISAEELTEEVIPLIKGLHGR